MLLLFESSNCSGGGDGDVGYVWIGMSGVGGCGWRDSGQCGFASNQPTMHTETTYLTGRTVQGQESNRSKTGNAVPVVRSESDRETSICNSYAISI
ncbi:hypothetical protein TWF506_011128 [Arthrobotrys conoides]|uniref:Uncharacterized protein n=1 Tax=Arthrobotrys conoides TaxID=74498 RepID=A0AAN8RVB3_9PEZI